MFTYEKEKGQKNLLENDGLYAPLEACKFAYTYANIKCIKVPDNRKYMGTGDSGGIAGKDWYRCFMDHLKTL